MGTPLEYRLSEMIGDGKNRLIRFSFEDSYEVGRTTPLLVIRLNDDRLVEMSLARVRNAMYSLTVGDEKVKVFMGRSLVQVVDGSGKTLAEQKYSPVHRTN